MTFNTNKTLLQHTQRIEQSLIEKKILQTHYKEKETRKKEMYTLIQEQEKARFVIQTVSAQTQNNVRDHINIVVSTALQAVFGDVFVFDCIFIPKRGKTECTLVIKDKEGNELKPIDSCGGGVLDVISFALRCAFWSLKQTRKTLILDEPFKFLSSDLLDNAVEMIQLIATQLELQLIIVSHIPKFITAADTVFLIQKNKNISTVTHGCLN